MIWRGVPGPPTGRRDVADLEQTLDAIAMAVPRLQDPQHLDVVTSATGLAGQRPADVVGHVEVADADRVCVTVCALSDLRRGPRPHAGNRLQCPVDLGEVPTVGERPLERLRDGRRPPERCAPDQG